MARASKWFDKRALLLLHDESLAEHGGLPGLRDEGLLDSALARPLNLAAYGDPDVCELAASYCVGLAKNHPFVDSNKRAAFLALGLFLYSNGQRLTAPQAEATLAVLAVAAGDWDEATLAAWLRERTAPRA
ncbi:MAG: death-on-curing protein [Hydrogenophilales bacterium 16-64-46]|nr:MAG: death-on-curing protein [Hydrogenophilales bacterium 12-64-13]OYZ05859.1 MAG: death-on-curing protein [Hydrogenophilales bacterium 16-64-46]OZA39795.1 MAG: death-on-curing protein [Hydrogenophilales bacterium 17-64-34]HQS98662.1 type II toxin-antitoxin system death-on-curing family toxin [Thiobacillus sp.]